MPKEQVGARMANREEWNTDKNGSVEILSIEGESPYFKIDLGVEFSPLKDEAVVLGFLDFCAKWQLGIGCCYQFPFGDSEVALTILPVKEIWGSYSDYLVYVADAANPDNLGGVLYLESDYGTWGDGLCTIPLNQAPFGRVKNRPYF